MVKLTSESSYARFVLETCYSQMLPELIFANSLEKFKKKIGLLRNTLSVIFCMSKEYWISC